MTTTPDVLQDPDSAADRCTVLELELRAAAPEVPLRTITAEQLDQAVLQLRERRGRPAAEQMQAVLRALDLVVLPRNEHRR